MTTSPDSEKHLSVLDNGWSLWRSVALRSTGFSIHLLEMLAAPEAVSAIDRYLELLSALQTANQEARRLCHRLIASLNGEERAAWRRAERKLLKNKVPEAIPGDDASEDLFGHLAELDRNVREAFNAAAQETRRGIEHSSSKLREINKEPSFREALVWQNRTALATASSVLSNESERRNKAVRRAETVVVKYLQRYAAKNDTIGFFGPIGWATWNDRGRAINVEPGAGLLSSRHVYFEYWCIDTLGEVFSRDPEILRGLCPRIHPWRRLTTEGIWNRGATFHKLHPSMIRLLEVCDGETTAAGIAQRISAEPDNAFINAQQVLSALLQLARQGMVVWGVKVPFSFRPEDAMHALLRQLPAKSSIHSALGALGELEGARALLARNQSDPDTLASAMQRLETTFTRLTHANASRRHGQMYAGRNLVYEDCVRDVTVNLGQPLLDALRSPLSLVLQTSAWYLNRIAVQFEGHIESVYESLRAPDSVVRFDRLMMHYTGAQSVVDGLIEATLREVDARWREICGFSRSNDSRTLSVDSQQIGARVAEYFADEPPVWPLARYHSPDVMIAASDVAAIENGECLFVLGEVHSGFNAIATELFSRHHPTPDLIEKWVSRDLAHPTLNRGIADDKLGLRVHAASQSPDDFEVFFGATPSWRTADKTIRPGELLVESTSEGLRLRTEDSRAHFHIRESFPMFLGGMLLNRFNLFQTGAHTPRILCDRLVIARESWRFPCTDLPFASLKTTTERFMALREWIRRTGLPRRTFYKSPLETKPIYVDFESPHSVGVLSSIIRHARDTSREMQISFTEMLPTNEHCWLFDHQGNRYACELRMIGVGPRPYRSPWSDVEIREVATP